MARRKKEAPHENHERWLVSYADFITLLFAFFVVMFASSQTDKSRAKQVSQAVEKALADGKTLGVPPAVANLFFLPAASKIKARIHGDVAAKELMLEGVISILEGMNPKLIRVKLEAFLPEKGAAKKAKGSEAAQASQAVPAG